MKKALITIPVAVVLVMLLGGSICIDRRADANFDSLRLDMDTVVLTDTATVIAPE